MRPRFRSSTKAITSPNFEALMSTFENKQQRINQHIIGFELCPVGGKKVGSADFFSVRVECEGGEYLPKLLQTR